MEGNYRATMRLHQLARHVGPVPSAPQEDNAWLRASLCQLACRTGGEDFQRRDNRTLYARESSDGHGQFMRQMQAKEVVHGERREDDAALTSASAPGYAAGDSRISAAIRSPRVASDAGPGPNFAAAEPLFGKPAPDTDFIEKLVTHVADQRREPDMPAPREERGSNSQQRCHTESAGSCHVTPTDVEAGKKVASAANDQSHTDGFGFEWFPRMDVVESGKACVITIELPGVCADGIRVEVVRGSLIVTGSRATDWWKANSNGSNGGSTVYHRRELAQGPYRAVWRLPKNSDINGITAEFIDGFLRVLVPKIKIMTYL